MPVPANTIIPSRVRNIRESLSEKITKVWPDQTPFWSKVEKEKAKSTKEEWLVSDLPTTQNTNVKINGDTVSYGSLPQAARRQNFCQLSDRPFLVADVMENIDQAGYASQVAADTFNAGVGLRFDMERALTTNQASVDAVSDTAGATSAGLESQISTNVTAGTGGSTPGYNTTTGIFAAPTDAVSPNLAASFTEADMRDVIGKITASSGMADVDLYLGLRARQDFSAFSGRGVFTQNYDSNQNKIQVNATVDRYRSDFGTHNVVTNFRQRQRTALFLNFDYLEVRMLQPFEVVSEGKVGHSTRKFYRSQYTLVVKNEKALGKRADINYPELVGNGI